MLLERKIYLGWKSTPIQCSTAVREFTPGEKLIETLIYPHRTITGTWNDVLIWTWKTALGNLCNASNDVQGPIKSVSYSDSPAGLSDKLNSKNEVKANVNIIELWFARLSSLALHPLFLSTQCKSDAFPILWAYGHHSICLALGPAGVARLPSITAEKSHIISTARDSRNVTVPKEAGMMPVKMLEVHCS